MYYLLFYEKGPGYAERQKPHQDAHLAYLENLAARGTLLLAGSLEDPFDGSALLVFKAESADEIAAIAEGDPFVKHGIISKWQVRKWDVVLGSALPSSGA